MNTKLAAAAGIFVVMVIILAIHYWNRESFSSNRSRAKKIVSWFSKNDKPRYVDYRNDIAGGNIVEYKDAADLKRNGQLNIDSLSNLL